MIKKNLTSSIILVMMLLITPCVSAQTYQQFTEVEDDDGELPF